jgi:hypothetical protein
MWSVFDQIVSSPPVSLVSAAVKLRLLCDPDIGLDAGGNEDEVEAVRQVLGLVERVASDDAILSLFRQWIEFRRAADRVADDNAAEWERQLGQADAVEAEIAAASPSAVGLAVKAYLFLHLDFFGNPAHEGAAVAPGTLFEGEVNPSGDVAFATSILRDAVVFVPELASFVEPVLAAARKQGAACGSPPSTEGEGSR